MDAKQTSSMLPADYYTLGRGRGLCRTPGPVETIPGVINPLWSICGRGRGPYLRPLGALPCKGAPPSAPTAMEVDEGVQLPKVGAVAPRPSQGPRRGHRTRVVRSSWPSAAAIAASLQEKHDRAQTWGLYNALHEVRAQEWAEAELDIPKKRHCPEATQMAVTINQWSEERHIEGNY